MPRAGIEPARPFRAKGFSYHCGFHHQAGNAEPVWGLDYSFTIGSGPLGVSCLVSAPSSIGRLGSRLPSARPVKVSLNLRHSTSLLSERALKLCLSPSCLPFHHQGGVWVQRYGFFMNSQWFRHRCTKRSVEWKLQIVRRLGKVPWVESPGGLPLIRSKSAVYIRR